MGTQTLFSMLAFTQLIVVRHWLADFTANGKALDMRTSASRIASVQGTSVHGSFWGSYTFATLACISRGMQLCDHFVPGDGCTCKISGYGWIGAMVLLGLGLKCILAAFLSKCLEA